MNKIIKRGGGVLSYATYVTKHEHKRFWKRERERERERERDGTPRKCVIFFFFFFAFTCSAVLVSEIVIILESGRFQVAGAKHRKKHHNNIELFHPNLILFLRSTVHVELYACAE